MVVHDDPVDDRAKVRFAERNLAIGDFVAHSLAKLRNRFEGNFGWRSCSSLNPVKCGLRSLPVQLEASDSVGQNIVQFSNTLLDHPIEPLQLIGGVHNFSL
ncbi:hypothetical protein [Tardiphaga sp.]|uniref:hypothetical protein n=1 Tax=Tardiphaga sp. TaxID=1926292 RepID=UPI002626993F|nr:hypothetical protein [Tardiphaga sp.]